MLVEFFPASEFDAMTSIVAEKDMMEIFPKFYTAKGSSMLGMIAVTNQRGTVLDRAKLVVSGHGKLGLIRLSKPVVPVADSAIGVADANSSNN